MLYAYANRGSYTTKFSTILRVARGVSLSTPITMADADGKDPTPAYVEKIIVSFPDGYDSVASEGRGCEISLLIRPRFNNVHDDQKKGSRDETEVRKRKDIPEQKGINQNCYPNSCSYIITSQCSVVDYPQQTDSGESYQAKDESHGDHR